MAAELGRVEEARAWFEEGTRTLEGAASVALWQAWAVLEAKQGDPAAVRYLFKKALAANPRSRWVWLCGCGSRGAASGVLCWGAELGGGGGGGQEGERRESWG